MFLHITIARSGSKNIKFAAVLKHVRPILQSPKQIRDVLSVWTAQNIYNVLLNTESIEVAVSEKLGRK